MFILHPVLLVMLMVLGPCLAGEAPVMQQRDVAFAVITTPASAASNQEVAVAIALKAEAAVAGLTLFVDQHALVGQQRKAGLGNQRFAVQPGKASDHVARFTVPDLPGITRVAFPIYLSPKGWAERVAATEVEVQVQGRIEAKQPQPKAQPTVIDAPARPIVQPPVEVRSAMRAEMVLNGPWNFRPAGAGRTFEAIPADDWGQIWVPGSWGRPTGVIPGLIRTRPGAMWANCTPDLVSAWYERTVAIPADWAGRAIALDLARVSTEAIVYANGRECGVVTWPGGEVDITQAVKAGEEATLRVRVFAVESGGMELVAMGTLDGDFMRPARLESRGLIGDVVLASRPRGARIADVLAIPSVSERKLRCRVELSDAIAGTVRFTARLCDEQGRVEKTFTQDAVAAAAARQTVELAWAWPDPRLWDIGQPNLYTLRLEAQGGGLADEYVQRFGFREFRIAGTEFLLNGRSVRLRPWNVGVARHNGGGMQEIADSVVRIRMDQGINHLYIWPNDPVKRGSLGYSLYEAWFDAADRQGMLMSAPAPWFSIRSDDRSIKDVIDWTPAKREQYKLEVDRHLRRYRNHPAIVLWGSTANQFALQRNENPRLLGRISGLPDDLRDYTGRNLYRELAAAGRDVVAAFKEVDPIRPIYCHHSAFVGEMTNINLYLGMHQLQEREDWLSAYAKHGEVPFTSHEFGMPVDVMFTRGRSGNHGRGLGAEPLVSEFCAIYQGTDAYRDESPAYRAQIRMDFGSSPGNESPYGKWAPHFFLGQRSPNHVKFQALFARNTWRSWRTWGMAGGLYPWWAGNYATKANAGTVGFQRENADEPVAMPAFAPGRRGPYLEQVPVGVLYSQDPAKGGYAISEAGQALLDSNGPTLAWIAGPGGNFTAKDHAFTAGETVAKQIVVINDQITPDPAYSATWSAEIAGQRVSGGTLSGTIASGKTISLPITFSVGEVAAKTDGVIRLEATVGTARHRDAFPFRIHPKAAQVQVREVAILDPEGATTAWLQSLGYACRPWAGEQAPLLVIGRNALGSAARSALAGIDAYVRQGGRLVICNQAGDWSGKNLKLRTCPQVSRRAWPVADDHPVTSGLDGEDFRDWRGAGSACPEELHTEIGVNQPHRDHGWHWGNRGSVATAAVEMPHLSGWRPILVGEFDLAYSPLMELALGKGLMLWCALDLEGRTQRDPVAELITRRILDYTATRSVQATRPVAYLGDAAGRALFDQLGIVAVPAKAGTDQVLVVGPGVRDGEIEPFAAAGHPILVLARHDAAGPLGTTLRLVEAYTGSRTTPSWPESRGLTASDLRLRTDAAWWILDGGCDITADGLLGRKRIGASQVLFCQLDPQTLDADRRPYFRYTRWRQHRAIANLLANLGAEFTADGEWITAVSGTGTVKRRLYHPDYKTDFVSGDDPYRWNAW